MLYVLQIFPAGFGLGIGFVEVMDEEQVTNLVIERLFARDCYLFSRDAGKILRCLYPTSCVTPTRWTD
jgi:hypothetical protein